MTEESITNKLREASLHDLSKTKSSQDIWVSWDESEIRKPHSNRMDSLMKVRSLKGNLVNGYRMFLGLTMVPGHRSILYQHVFSSNEDDFESQNSETYRGLESGIQALQPLDRDVTHIFDRWHDHKNLWFFILNHSKQHFLCRLRHFRRKIFVKDQNNTEIETSLESEKQNLKQIGVMKAKMKVCKRKQSKAKFQEVHLAISSTPVVIKGRQEYALEKKLKKIDSKEVYFVEVKIKDTNIPPCYLMTDWEIDTAFMAEKIARMYLQRWSVEDSFRFIKQLLGFESVQLLNLDAIRTLLALASVAASYLFYNTATIDWPEVELLARLGGWQYRKNSPPGKIVITRGIQKILDKMVTDAVLEEHRQQKGKLPERVLEIMSLGDF